MKLYTENKDKKDKVLNELKEFLSGKTYSDIAMIQEQFLRTKIMAQVHFVGDSWAKIQALVTECSKEIAWDGFVTRDEAMPNVFYIEDIIVYPQNVTSTTVTTDDAKWVDYENSIPDDLFNKKRFNGHSHVHMGVTPSGTDTTFRDQRMQNVTDFYIFGIFNKKKEVELQIFDVENNIIYDDKDIEYYIPGTNATAWAKEQIKLNINETTTYQYNANQYRGQYGGAPSTHVTGSTNSNVNKSSVNNPNTSVKPSDALKDDAETAYEKYLREHYGQYFDM